MKKFLALILAASMAWAAQAQKAVDPVVFEINGKKIYKSEFMKEFLRSIGKDPKAAPTACTYEKREALNNYVELFVNYRTKLENAYELGYDTIPDLVNEFMGYRNELAAPYLIDSVTLNDILREAYERNHYVLHASHILVRVDKNASPEDTLKAYKKAMECYRRAVAGEDFAELAYENTEDRMSSDMLKADDPRRKNFGDLGSFSVFDMVYPFETAVYGLEVGEISKPVRSDYGYHIILLKEKTPFFGKCSLQHIWISSKLNPYDGENRIQMAYSRLKNGEDFGTVCRDFSNDKSSVDNGGLMSDISMRQMPTEYVPYAAKLKPGEFSEPFRTDYGWHIVKLLRRDSIPSLEEMTPLYKQRLARDQRSVKPRESFIEQCKKHYDFKDYTKMYTVDKKLKKPMASLNEAVSLLTDSVFVKRWKYVEGSVKDLRPLFSVAGKEYTAVDLLKFVADNQHFEPKCPHNTYLEDRYRNFINDKVFEYADKHLETEHPEFGDLMREYRDGLMIFAYNDGMIWSKAIHDTTGLDEFYKKFSAERDIDNEADAPYFWNERANITVFTFEDSTVAPSKVLKVVEKATKKEWNTAELDKKISALCKGDTLYTITQQLVEKEHQNILKNNQWQVGIYEQTLPAGYRIVRVDKVQPPALKSRKEARGYYINEYQNFLERQLVQQLRKKYNVVIHQDVIDEITY